MTALSNPLPAR